MKSFLLIIAIFFVGNIQAQTLSLKEFLAIVKRHHPIARQAAIGVGYSKG
jgi:predicted esterase